MAVLPLTVDSVDYLGTDRYGVTLTLADGTQRVMIIPQSMANIEAVSIAAVALAQLLEAATPSMATHHRGHRRYDPRLGS